MSRNRASEPFEDITSNSTSDTERKLEWPVLESVPRHFVPLTREAERHLARYYSSAKLNELEKWKEALNKVITDRRFKFANSQFRAGIYYRYGVALNWIVVLFENSHNFDEAKKFWSLAVELSHRESSVSLRSRYNIAVVLTNEYRKSRIQSLLDEAVNILVQCTHEAAPDLPEAALCLEGLSWALERRYRATGGHKDLLASVAAAESCVARIISDSSMTVRYKARLAAVLQMRFDLFGNMADLDRSVSIYMDLRAAIRDEGVDFLAYMGQASTVLRIRYELKGDIEDLLAAVEIGRSRLERVSPGTHNYEHALDSYGVALRALFEARRKSEDINAAVKCHQLAVNSLDRSHEHFAGTATNLGNSLQARYYAYRDRNDLDGAVEAYRSAFEQSSGSQHALRAYNLASVLLEAHSDRLTQPLTEEINALLRTAYEQGSQNRPDIALRTSIAAGRWHQDNHRFHDAGSWYSNGLLIVQQFFREQNIRDDKLVRIRQMASLPVSAAFCHAESGKNSEAVLALEQGRALLLTETLERKAAELASLEDAGHSDLVRSYQKASALLEMAVHAGQN